MVQFLITLLVLVVSSISSLAPACYVIPDNSSSSCPGQPCQTLDQYASQQTKYFTSGATFMFLAGNHTSNSSLLLHNTFNIALKAIDNDSDVIVLCKTAGVIQSIESVNLTIQGMRFVFETDTVNSSSIINIVNSRNILFINSIFLGNSDGQVRAVYCKHSDIAIVRSRFEGNKGDSGGAIYAKSCNLTLNNNTLNKNRAERHGGALAIVKSNLTIDRSVFNGNTGGDGGAIYAIKSSLILNRNAFYKNKARYGGAILSSDSFLLLEDKLGGVFEQNLATTSGGAVNCINSTFIVWSNNAINSTQIQVANNLAEPSGAISFHGQDDRTFLTTYSEHLLFIDNVAKDGGGIYSWRSSLSLSSTNFTNNTCIDRGRGGALSSIYSNISLHDFTATKNYRALETILSSVSFSGNVTISKNYGHKCGGILAMRSSTYFKGHTMFEGNHVSEVGGAVCTDIKSTLYLSGTVLFSGNHAATAGGAIYAHATSTIIVGNNVSFIANSAGRDGGAIFFENGARLSLKQNSLLTLTDNHADENGGALYHKDSPTFEQCKNHDLPISCFIMFFRQTSFTSFPYKISARNNSANKEGGFLFGGLLDKCSIYIFASDTPSHAEWGPRTFYPILLNVTAGRSDTTLPQEISSQAYQLCFCKEIEEFNCTERNNNAIIQRGGKFTVPLMALAQGDTIVSSPVRARIRSTARLLPEQGLQYLERNCTSLNFNMYSSQEQEQLTLYLDESPCLDTGLSQAVINVTFSPCPDGFTLSGDHCICEERLWKYHAYCTMCDEGVYITKKAGSTFWLSPLNSSNKTYLGLILYPTCLTQYCKTDSVNISLNDPDIQCAHNRSGVLCGACATNYSLTFGSSRCEICPNTHLALLLAFAAAGIILVVLLTLLRLTVATGMINSVILYANIVQTNKDILVPNSSIFLKVFIAWLNFDFGIQTCFYDGMDAYAQTWLQLAFPVYVWILISLIILASRYSMAVTKLIGSNPIAVLATLLLMSYAKLLKIIIEVYSSVDLEYPGNKTVTVWLKDANEPYLQSRHLVLTVVTTLLLVFLFLPYTLLLLLGYKLYRFTGRKSTCWLTRIKPLLDSYYAPYKMRTRYWTGFLLLLRCALYIIFSYNSLGHTTLSLLAIIIAFAAIIVTLSVKIYSKLLWNILEGVVYFNLIVLCAIAQVQVNSPSVVNSLVGMVFAILIGIIIYHFHFLYIAKSVSWLKLHAKMAALWAKPVEASPLLAPVASEESHQGILAYIAIPPKGEPTRSVLSMRT